MPLATAPRSDSARGDRASGRRRRPRKRIVAIDFFCGAGGLSEGLRRAGITVLAGVDNDPLLKDTYEANHGVGKFLLEDITTIDIAELRERLGVRPDDIVIYAACTPCQPFSTLNQRRGRDDRKELLLTFGKMVRQCPPDYVLVENVPGLKNAYGRDIHQLFLEDLAEAGITHSHGDMIDASDYAVPQIRKRFVLLASAHGEIRLPAPEAAPKRTVRQALAGLPAAVPDGQVPETPNHVYRRPKANHERILRRAMDPRRAPPACR